MLAAYDACPPLGDLMIRRSTDNGRTWQSPQVVREDPAPHGYGDPSLVIDRVTGRILRFYAAGQNQGFSAARPATTPTTPAANRQHRRITPQVKDPAWGGLFAASGAGIQIKRGRYARRLVQQYTVRGDGVRRRPRRNLADGPAGRTGRVGHQTVRCGADVEHQPAVGQLDRLVLGGARDGGQSWQGLHADSSLIDPANNGPILRYNENAAPGSRQADWLLFSKQREHVVAQQPRDQAVLRQRDDLACPQGRRAGLRGVLDFDQAARWDVRPALGEQALHADNFSRFDPNSLDGVCAAYWTASHQVVHNVDDLMACLGQPLINLNYGQPDGGPV